jgi:CO/xanthine dehydrogenase Mo-binding subunit
MDDKTTEAALSLTKFGIGQPVPRSEDPRLVRGEGCYTDDTHRTGQTYAVMVRSNVAHGVIRGIDTAAAKAMPGVLAVYTAADLAGYGPHKCNLPLKNRDGSPIRYTPRPALAADKVRFVGDPVACVIAETLAQAKDAAEAVVLDIEPLTPVLGSAAAMQPGAPRLYDAVPNNLALDYHFGDAEKVAATFAQAAHITRLQTSNQRMIVAAMEPRAAIGEFDAATCKWTLHSSSQGVMGMKATLMDILGAGADKVRVLTGNVGGSFGMKAGVYPEYVCILHGARMLGRPVKWTDERSGSFVSDHHGRAQDMTVEIAFDAGAHILALRLTGYGDMGSYLAQFGPLLPTGNVVKNVVGAYRTPLLELTSRCVFTNTTYVSAYRGAGLPEGNYYMERPLDLAAAEPGIDRIELRRRNLIRKSELPFKAPPPRPMTAATSTPCSSRRWNSPTTRASPSASAKARSADCCAASASPIISKSPPPTPRRWAASASTPTAPSPSSPARSTTARATPPLSRRCSAKNSACRSSAFACCKATATSWYSAAAPAARVRPCSVAARSAKRRRKLSSKANQSPRMCWKPPWATSNSRRGVSSSPAPTARSACWSWPNACAPV